MKPQHFAIVAGSLLVAAVILLITGRPPANENANLPAARTVTVTGEAEVQVKPDQAQIRFGIWTHGASAAEAEALNLASVTRVQEALAAAGVSQTDLQVIPAALATDTYQDYSGTTRLTGFQAVSRVEGTVRNLAKVQAAIDAALKAGATAVEEIRYTVDDTEPGRVSAMKAALENAKERAGTLVRAQGEALGELQSFEVLPEDTPSFATAPGALRFRARVKATYSY